MKIAVIGTGYWGPNLVRNLLALDQDLVLFDSNAANLQSTIYRFPGCKSVDSLEEILQDKEIPAVVIAVRLKQHYNLIKTSLDAGKHVFVEKSLCYSSEQADKIGNHLTDKILMVGHTTLYSSGIIELKDLLEKKRIGVINNISFRRSHFGPIYPEIDVASEVASHDIATALFLINDLPFSVNAWSTSKEGNNTRDTAFINLAYRNSLIINIIVRWLGSKRERLTFVEGSGGTIEYNSEFGMEELTLAYQRSAVDAIHNGGKPKDSINLIKHDHIELKTQEPLYNELNTFLNCIENNIHPITDFCFGKKVVSVLEAIRKSLKLQGKTIRIQW